MNNRPQFFGIFPGEEKSATGIRVAVTPDGERVWMHGKWLDLGAEHAVAWIDGPAEFIRPDGRRLKLGSFPAWVASGNGRRAPCAVMFSVTQFRGGRIVIGRKTFPVDGGRVAA
jgi:hypothetical protein